MEPNPYEAPRRAAEPPAAHATLAMTGKHDQVDTVGMRVLQDLFCRFTLRDRR